MKNVLHYSIVPKDLSGHLFEVSVTIDTPAADGRFLHCRPGFPAAT